MKTWLRRRGDRVTITTVEYTGHQGTIDANVYQKTGDYPTELSNGFQVMLDTEQLVTVRWDQVEGIDVTVIERTTVDGQREGPLAFEILD